MEVTWYPRWTFLSHRAEHVVAAIECKLLNTKCRCQALWLQQSLPFDNAKMKTNKITISPGFHLRWVGPNSGLMTLTLWKLISSSTFFLMFNEIQAT
mmetsp:Transcript_79115/g.132583  ORF Transcript_79115/g.132583 Transcript_79115/m.132583 type:complete len:97 (+) Transcript_79115:74-364(+)